MLKEVLLFKIKSLVILSEILLLQIREHDFGMGVLIGFTNKCVKSRVLAVKKSLLDKFCNKLQSEIIASQ